MSRDEVVAILGEPEEVVHEKFDAGTIPGVPKGRDPEELHWIAMVIRRGIGIDAAE